MSGGSLLVIRHFYYCYVKHYTYLVHSYIISRINGAKTYCRNLMWVANEKPAINDMGPNCCVYMYHCNYMHRHRKQIESVEAILEENPLCVVFQNG